MSLNSFFTTPSVGRGRSNQTNWPCSKQQHEHATAFTAANSTKQHAHEITQTNTQNPIHKDKHYSPKQNLTTHTRITFITLRTTRNTGKLTTNTHTYTTLKDATNTRTQIDKIRSTSGNKYHPIVRIHAFMHSTGHCAIHVRTSACSSTLNILLFRCAQTESQ